MIDLSREWQFHVADALAIPLPDQSVDLVVGSPPYTDCRTYDDGTLPAGHVVSLDTAEWIDWMLLVTSEALRVSKGAVVWVAGCPTRDRDYQPACEGLKYRWWIEGWGELGAKTYERGSMYRPVYWNRVGIPGSGGDQWFRADVEYCMGFKRPGPLPWSDNTAMGHPPKWAPGGKLSYRDADGNRRHKIRGTSGYANGDAKDYRASEGKLLDRAVTEIANPGNIFKTLNGGGHLGHAMAHDNEAPYPVEVPEFFIKSLCPPDGITADFFSGSGTTVHAAVNCGRRGIGFDLRQSQIELGERRMKDVCGLFAPSHPTEARHGEAASEKWNAGEVGK